MISELQGILKALKGSPFDDIPTGDAGLPADALTQWAEMEPWKRIKDYNISRGGYIKNVYEKNMPRRDVDPGWELDADVFQERLANCPAGRIWGSFTDELPDDSELTIFTYAEISEARGSTIRRPSALVKEYHRTASWTSWLLRHSGNKRRNCIRRYGFVRRLVLPAHGLRSLVPLEIHLLQFGTEAFAPWRLPSNIKSFLHLRCMQLGQHR